VYGDSLHTSVVGNSISGYNGFGINITDAGQGGLNKYAVVRGNRVIECMLGGIIVMGSKFATIANNYIYNNSQASAGSYNGINIVSASSGGAQVADTTTVHGNISFGAQQRNAFNVDSSAPAPTNIVFFGNRFGPGLVGTIQLNSVAVSTSTINGTLFDGDQSITITAAAGTLTGTTLNSTVVTSSLTSVGILTALAVTGAAPAFTRDNIITTSTDGAVLQNTTASTAGVPVQQSPRLRLRSQVWNTTATAVNNTNDWFVDSVPVSGAVPSGLLKIGSILNGGAATYPATLTSAGKLDVAAIDSATGTLTLGGTANITCSGNIAGAAIRAGGASILGWTGLTSMKSTADGVVTMTTQGATIGSEFKVDALPTVTAGGGTSPSVTAGSTPLAGSVNVGTGAPGATITVTFGGTAFPSAPFVVCMNVTTGLAVKATSSTTTLVITPQTGNFGVSDVITWICISSK
jgi:hypothetical protein